MPQNHLAEDDEGKRAESKAERLQKGAEDTIRSDAKPEDREGLKDRHLEAQAEEQRTRAMSPEEAAIKAKRGEKVVGDATKALGFSLGMEAGNNDGSKHVLLPGRSPEDVKALQKAESSSKENLPFDPDEVQGKASSGSDGVFRYQGYVSNVPDVSRGVTSIQDLSDVREGAVRGVENVVKESLEYLSQAKSVENSLLGIGPALDSAVDYYSEISADQVLKDATQFAGAGIQALEQNLGHPMTQQEIGEPVGEAATFFIPVGTSKVLKASEMDALGGMQKLEKLTEEELEMLGLRRAEMPKINLTKDEYSIQGSISGDRDAWIRAETPRPGVLNITSIDKGALPDGMGGEFMAEVFKGHDALPTKQLSFQNVTNKETLAAFSKGIPPEESLLGKCAKNGLKSLGITPTSFRYEWVEARQRLNIVIETTR